MQSQHRPWVRRSTQASSCCASMDNTAFFKNRPKGDADADKLLPRGTSMKVISTSRQLCEGGTRQRRSRLCADDHAGGSRMPSMPPRRLLPVNPSEFQVYPPVDGFGEPLPPVNPGEMPPEGAIPTVIDPEAPATDLRSRQSPRRPILSQPRWIRNPAHAASAEWRGSWRTRRKRRPKWKPSWSSNAAAQARWRS